ncbi:MAG: hypothetical protein ACTHYY_08595 [Agrococcus casei]|uniref:hypothetical protein n=1 Tax=Agrococcus casei TaxID=343512 RepID=UPI003F8EF25D
MRRVAVGAVVLLAMTGCASGGGEADESADESGPSQSTETSAPLPSETDEQTATPALSSGSLEVPLDADAPASVHWIEPGKTLRIYVSGSSTPGCVPTPIEATTDGTQVTIDFEPVDAALTCTMDLVIHGWEVEWDQPFAANGPLPLTLTNTSEDETEVESEISDEPFKP